MLEWCKTDLKRFWSLDIAQDTPKADIFSQVSCGVVHLHNNGILHLNLRPSNILLSYDSTNKVCVKISNFAHARSIGENETQSTIKFHHIIKMRGWITRELLKVIRNGEIDCPVVSTDV